MIKYFLQSVQREFKTSPKLLITFAVIASVGMITLAVVVISMVWAPAPPDAATADIKTVAEFMKTDEFNELSPGKKQRYLKSMHSRVDKMNSQDKKMARNLFREVERANPKAARTLHVGYATHRLSALNGKTPEQTQARIRATLAVMEAVKGRRGMKKEYQKIIGETPERRRAVLKEAFKSASDVYKTTSIEERRNAFKTMVGVQKELEARYGK